MYNEAHKRAAKKYVTTHREQFNAYQRSWRKSNRDKIAAVKHANYVKRRDAGKIKGVKPKIVV